MCGVNRCHRPRGESIAEVDGPTGLAFSIALPSLSPQLQESPSLGMNLHQAASAVYNGYSVAPAVYSGYIVAAGSPLLSSAGTVRPWRLWVEKGQPR